VGVAPGPGLAEPGRLRPVATEDVQRGQLSQERRIAGMLVQTALRHRRK